jgi:hypothetical protein
LIEKSCPASFVYKIELLCTIFVILPFIKKQGIRTMQNNKTFKYLTLLLILLVSGNANLSARSQDITVSEAMQLFDSGKYEAAETAFRQLLKKKPENTLLIYYYGASRTENGHFSKEDLNFLLEAGKDVTPHRRNYYLAVQYHALENWNQALKFYNQFRVSVPEEEQQKVKLAQKIQQCYDRINPYKSNAEAEAGERMNKKEVETEPQRSGDSLKTTGRTEEKPQTQEKKQAVILGKKDKLVISADAPPELKKGIAPPPRKNLPDLPGVKSTFTPPEGDPINFKINSNITYLNTAHFKTEKGKKLFLKGNSLQEKLDENIKKTNELRKKYNNLENEEEKAIIGEKILVYEKESYRIKEEVTQLFSASRRTENQYWQKAGEIKTNNFIVDLNKMKAAQQKKIARHFKKQEKDDNSWLISAMNLFDMPAASQEQTQKAEASPLIYKIQIGAYSKKLPAYVDRLYKKLALIRKIETYTDEDGVVVYTTGNLTNLEDAKKLQNQLQQEGIEDAFIVPFFKGKRITLEQAKKKEARNDIKRD